MQYPNLFSEIKIGNTILKNRTAMTAMGVCLAHPTGEASPAIIRYYEERARGGVGLIITEIVRIDEIEGVGISGQLSATNMRHIPGLQRLADAVHAHGAKIFLQLQHPGKEASSQMIGRQPVSASATANIKGEMARELTTEEVQSLVRKFITGAAFARAAGVDGVELHAAHGYLINQFLSPKYNLRTDQYGGSFENRFRMLAEIIAGVKAVCPGFTLSVRISADEFTTGGNGLEEGVEIACAIEKAGADVINVSNGTHESGVTIMEPYTYPQGWKKHLATAVKKAVSIPVIAVNTVKEPDMAERLLEEGVCDIVGMGRAMLADPEWVHKAHSGNKDMIRKCVGCMQCFYELGLGRHVSCAINPRLGREIEYAELKRDGNGRRAAVIGGGPAGIQAAIVLGQRGFDVTLFEKAGVLGGSINLANKSPHKDILDGLLATMKKELQEAKVRVMLNAFADADAIRKLDPEYVFIACGAKPIVPKLPGIDKALVFDGVLGGTAKAGDTVLVVGGGLTGLETAEFLAAQGKSVTLIEMTKNIGTGVYASLLYVLRTSLEKLGVKILTKHRLLGIEDGGADVMNLVENAKLHFSCESVVLALGSKPCGESLGEIKRAFPDAIVIGDSAAARRIMEATAEGYGRAFSVR